MSDKPVPHPGVLTAIRHVRHGQRADAVRSLTRTHANDPTDFRVTHALALMSLWALVRRGSARPDAWQLCLGLWANLLADPRFWCWFTEDARRRYRVPVPTADVDAVRDRLERWLLTTVTRCGGDDLAAALALEVRAARLVAVRGGIAAGRKRDPIPCGPMLVQHLALQGECRDLATSLLASRDKQTRRAAMYFSSLGRPLVHLDRGAPAAALAGLAGLWCADCEQRAGRRGDPRELRVCREDCPEFAERNPAYADVRGGRKRFLTAATVLAVEAHLKIAETALTAAELDIATAREHWRAAVRLPGSAELIHRQVTEFVLPRIRFLQTSRRDDAIAVLQALLTDPTPAPDDEAFGEAVRSLSQLLAARGVEYANREPSELNRAEADLRQAVELNPTSWAACRNLVVVLENRATQILNTCVPRIDDFVSATRLLTTAREYLSAFPGADSEVTTLSARVSEGLGAVLNAHAVSVYNRGDYDEALRLIERALAERPGDATITQNQRVIRSEYETDSYYERPYYPSYGRVGLLRRAWWALKELMRDTIWWARGWK